MNTDENRQTIDCIVNGNCTALILDLIPCKVSFAKQQYYAHPDNLFWDFIIPIVYPGMENKTIHSLNYSQKVSLLLDKGISIWSVLSQKDIRIYNDFDLFFTKYPNIKTIFFNGQNALSYFNKKYNKLSEKFEIRKIALPPTHQGNSKNCFTRLRIWEENLKLTIPVTFGERGLKF